jgi:hypothetical protein
MPMILDEMLLTAKYICIGIFGIHELNKGQQMCKFFFGIVSRLRGANTILMRSTQFNVIDDHTGQYNSAFWLENSEDLPKLTDDSTKGKEFDIFSPRTTTLPIIDVTDLMENHLEAGHACLSMLDMLCLTHQNNARLLLSRPRIRPLLTMRVRLIISIPIRHGFRYNFAMQLAETMAGFQSSRGVCCSHPKHVLGFC